MNQVMESADLIIVFSASIGELQIRLLLNREGVMQIITENSKTRRIAVFRRD